ncbi:MAG: hypothetical protein AVDCRST_MAG30-2703 [uncultured Solirubrobacteraceae bacterium]|uniref:Uncharacterized protein n=1 Tax=uncultured Solirubrobacteraceae bacterium TaxID=1162706 RepID=A0A6J4T6W8_9ACTN|nr:MAG: hypothetical protein AVDCRST_MAG30-2703 [uncultured Solirubrobacteraceae bacterium]
MRALVVSLAVAACLIAAAPAGAAWTGSGTCKVPAGQRESFPNVTSKTRLRTKNVPCYEAAFSVEDAARKGLLEPSRPARFEFRSFGARWVHDWTCRRTKREEHFSFSCRDEDGGTMSFRRPRSR